MAGTACDRPVSPTLRAFPVLTASPMNRWETRAWRGVLGLAVIKGQGCVQGSGPSLQTLPHAQVQSRRCDMKTRFVTHIPCTPCPAIKKRVCPSGWLREFPEKISQDCRCGPPLHPCLLPGVSCGMAGDREGLAGLGSEGRDSFIHMSVGPSIETEISREEGVRMQGKCCLLSIYYGPGPVFSSGPGEKGSGDQE